MTAGTVADTAKMPRVVMGVDLGVPLPQVLDVVARTMARECVRVLGSKKAAAHALGLSRKSLEWYLRAEQHESPHPKNDR